MAQIGDNKEKLSDIITKFFELECGFDNHTSKSKTSKLLQVVNSGGTTLVPDLVDDQGIACTCRSYTIKEYIYADGSMRQQRINDGYTALELLGLISFIKHDVITQIEGYKQPDTVKRLIVE